MTTNTRIDLKVPFVERTKPRSTGLAGTEKTRLGTHPLALTLKTSNGGCPGASFSNPRNQIQPRRKLPRRVSP